MPPENNERQLVQLVLTTITIARSSPHISTQDAVDVMSALVLRTQNESPGLQFYIATVIDLNHNKLYNSRGP